MPCLLVLLILIFPRVVLVWMYLTSTYLQRAYHGLLIPLLGFIFLPLTTIVYAWLVNSHSAARGHQPAFHHRRGDHRPRRAGRRRLAPPPAPVIAYHIVHEYNRRATGVLMCGL